MEQASNLQVIGQERRNKYELPRNDYKKGDTTEYSSEHETAKSDPGRGYKPELGKGTGHGGHLHTMPQPYNELTKNQIKPQIDDQNGGGAFDIEGRDGIGGRKRTLLYNVYDKDNAYGEDELMTLSENEGQFIVR